MDRAWIDMSAEYHRDDEKHDTAGAEDDFCRHCGEEVYGADECPNPDCETNIDDGVAYPTGDICRVCRYEVMEDANLPGNFLCACPAGPLPVNPDDLYDRDWDEDWDEDWDKDWDEDNDFTDPTPNTRNSGGERLYFGE